jgi:hypothetical protein
METISHRATSRVVCRIFIRATPQAVWDAICPALKQSGDGVSRAGTSAGVADAFPGDRAASARHLSGLITIGEILEADPPGRLVHALETAGANSPVRSSLLAFELRDTLTGYTALTVRCEPAGAQDVPDSGIVRACDWDRLLGDLKIILEADGRERRRTAPTRPSCGRPVRLRPALVPQAQVLSGGRLPPARPACALPGRAVRMSLHSLPMAGAPEPQARPGEGEPRAAAGNHERAASQRAECGDRDSDRGDRGTGIRGVIDGAGNYVPSRLTRRLR